MTTEPENLVLQLLRGLRSDMVKLDVKFDRTKAELKAELTAEINSLRADVASDILAMEKRTTERIEGLRQTVVQYHSSVVGHGFLISNRSPREACRASSRTAAAGRRLGAHRATAPLITANRPRNSALGLGGQPGM